MANKRRRAEVADESDNDSARSASSSQASAHKRSRVSQPPTNGANGVNGHQDGSDVEELDAEYTYQYHSHVQEDNTLHLDVSSGEDGEADPADELRATQMVQQHYQELKENMPSEQGIIEEVYMQNFMCHGKLRIALGPLINFIVGHNGSGKSAILTALTICLGAKAAATNRSANLKNFIKTGEESAYVAVKIKNQGDMAYQREDYGKSIIVERHFSKQGSSGFKIKNAEGKIMSTKRSELENIVDFFALQLDNPMNVLSQDLARQFLSNSPATEKYKFFIRGTQLEQLDSDYRMLEERLDDTEAKCEFGEQDVAVLGQEARAAEEKKKRLDVSASIDEKIGILQRQHAWAQIEEQERELAAIDSDIAKAENKIAMQESAAEHASKLYEESHSNREANRSVIQDLEGQLGPLEAKHEQHKTVFERNKQDLLNQKTEQRNIKQDMDGARKNISHLQTKIDAERTRIENANGPAHGQKVAALEQARSQLEDCIQRGDQHGASRMQLNNDMIQTSNEARNARPALQQKKQAIDAAQNMLHRLREDQGQQHRAYSREAQNVARAISNTRGFQGKVVGPLGHHVRLLNPEWASIIETVFGGTLEAFGVTCNADRATLAKIMKQHNCFANILINNGRRIDSSHNEPDANLDTILRVLEFDDDLVRNLLIINARIDQTVLIGDRDEANDFAQLRQRNVTATICHNPNKRGAGFRFYTTRSGGVGMGPVHPYTKMMRMKTSAEAQINMAQENLNSARREHQETENQIRALDNTANRAKQALTKHDRDAREMRAQKQTLEDRIEELQAELDRDTVNDTSALDELHSQLAEAQETLRASEASMQDAINAMDQLGDKQRGVKQQLDAVTKEVEEVKTQRDKAKKRLDEKENQRVFALRKKNECLEAVDEAKQARGRLDERRAEQAAVVVTWTEEAEKICRRVNVEPGNTPDALDKKIDALTRERERVEQSVGGNREQIYEAWRTARKKFGAAQRDLNTNKDTVKKLKQALLYRKNRWKLFRKYITTRAKITFGYLLSERNFRGRILVNHADKALDISVEPDISKSSDKGRQTKTLSGGEKSFSTICLLLSIWEAMGSPIRCLDEFDVFMDSANREISMKMMIQAARRSVGRQFVLITPQAMNSIEGMADVHVHKMADPERGQTTLNFAPA